MKSELDRRRRTTSSAFEAFREATGLLTSLDFCASLFDYTDPSALSYTAKMLTIIELRITC